MKHLNLNLLTGLYDFHCHLHKVENLTKILEKLHQISMGVLVMTESPLEYQTIKKLFNNHLIHTCLGLFPLSINRDKIELFFKLLPNCKYIGEIGLDYSVVCNSKRKLQVAFLERVLYESSISTNKIISLHSRGASLDMVNMIKIKFNGTLILHWFSGSVTLAKQVNENVYFSINTAMIKSKNSKKLIKSLNPSRLLLETDSPSVLYKMRQTNPLDALAIIDYLANIWRISPNEVSLILKTNTKKALG